MQKKPELFQIPGHQAIFQIALETQDDDKVANQTDTLEQFQVALLRNTWSFECIESAADIQNDTRYTNTRAKLSEDQLNSTDEQRTLNPNIDSDSLMSDDSSGESQPIR